MGYTANFVCGLWFGNDNYESTNRMTGGSLPAMTWHSIMAYAHQGVEIKQLPGVPVPHERQEQNVALKGKGDGQAPPSRPILLTRRGVDILVNLEKTMDDANKALGPLPTASAGKDRQARNKNGDALASELEGRAFGRN